MSAQKQPAATTRLDAITVEVIGSAFASIAEEMGKVLIRSAYSDNTKVRHDCSTALFDATGRTIHQAEHIPLHLGSLLGIIEHIYGHHDLDDIRPGDVFIGNDAYVGSSTHLQDIVLAEPIFHEGRFVAWAVNTAHHTDFIDRSHRNIFEEGLRIPPVKLYREGVLQGDVLNLILLNCLMPEMRRGDFRAQMAANRLGVQRFQQICAKYGIDTVLAATEEILDYSERKTRAGIRSIGDGVYTARTVLDSDLMDEPLDIQVKVVVEGDDFTVDFSGNPPQVPAGINAILNATRATVYLTVKMLVDQDIPANAGFYRPIKVIAPEGSIFNAVEPAAVYSRQDTVRYIVDMVRAALAPAIPDRVVAASTSGSIMTLSGRNPRTGAYFIHNETIGGGFGARATKDGLDAVQVYLSNSSNVPIETLETEFPFVVEAYELVPDSGGAGKYRGGLSIHRRLRVVDHEARVGIGGAGMRYPSPGLFGGLPGTATRTELSVGARPLDRRAGNLRAGEAVSVFTSGGAGYGNPRERDRALVRADLREGRISLKSARDIYGLTDPEICEGSVV